MKLAVILGDGMADWPVDELGGKTPLDAANHPYMDKFAQDGAFGLVKTVPDGMKPGSDTANLSVFGYDPKRYYSGRSPLEAASLGIDLAQTDVTYRCNLVTLSGESDIANTTMIDYSAGEISTEEARELILFLDQKLGGEGVRLYPGFSYRHCLVLNNAETGAELTPPHDFSGKPVSGKLPTGTNAALLMHWMKTAYALLNDHPVNRARVAAGKNPANAIWFWGEGRRPALTPFLEKTGLHGAVISAVDLIQGIGRCAGMEVVKVAGATGTFETNFAGKAAAAVDVLKRGADYVYVHIEAADECGHHGQLKEKIYSIEQI
ncbi:MAG: cofactor-independent phosphoglycerate mutase, partial [Clostridia bacterium]|nr:cofactor-independent phosphoglycerate mutase [Clostridia bacterium]